MSDLEAVVEILMDLDGKLSPAYGIKGDGQSLVETALFAIKHGICLIGRGAAAGGSLFRFPYNHNVLIGNILFWNFTKPSGVGIFQAMVSEFRGLGAKYVTASSHFPENRLGDFYCKQGLKAVETSWIAEISTMRHQPANKEKR